MQYSPRGFRVRKNSASANFLLSAPHSEFRYRHGSREERAPRNFQMNSRDAPGILAGDFVDYRRTTGGGTFLASATARSNQQRRRFCRFCLPRNQVLRERGKGFSATPASLCLTGSMSRAPTGPNFPAAASLFPSDFPVHLREAPEREKILTPRPNCRKGSHYGTGRALPRRVSNFSIPSRRVVSRRDTLANHFF